MNLKKIIREEIDDLQWIHDIRLEPFNVERATEEIFEYFKNGFRFNNDWVISFNNFTGVVEWVNQNNDEIVFYATPFWDGADYIPIDYQTEDGYGTITTIKIADFKYMEEFRQWLKTDYLEEVWRIIDDYYTRWFLN